MNKRDYVGLRSAEKLEVYNSKGLWVGLWGQLKRLEALSLMNVHTGAKYSNQIFLRNSQIV